MPLADWDPDDPPADPPAGADLLLWRLAYGLHRDHRPQSDGFCMTCREFWPCRPHRLAAEGFQAAVRPPERRPRPPGNSGHHY